MRNTSLEEEASNPQTCAQRLETLSADPLLRSIVAGNPSTPAGLLENLAQDEDARVREVVAGNPNTPWRVLELVAWEFPHAFLYNPVGPLQVMTHPEQINADSTFWDSLLREAALPSCWWSWLRSYPNLSGCASVRLHVQSAKEPINPFGTPREGEEGDLLLLTEMLTTACAQKVSLPFPAGRQIIEKHLQWLAQCSNEEVRLAVAWNALTPAEVLYSLASDEDWQIRLAVAESARASVETLRILMLDKRSDIQEALARNKQMPVELLTLFARDEEWMVRVAVAWNRQAPVEILRFLAADRIRKVRKAVAEHLQTPEEVLRFLAQDVDEEVRQAVAWNARTPVEVLRVLAQDSSARVRRSISSNEQTPAEILSVLAQDADVTVRSAVAWNPQTPLNVLHLLSLDTNATVRKEVGKNEQTPVKILLALARDDDWSVRMAVAWNIRTPVEVLQILARDENATVRQYIPRNPQTPEKLLHTLALDEDTIVRRLANLVLRLLAREALYEEGVREKLRSLLLGIYGNNQTPDVSIEKQLEYIVQMDVSENLQQTILAILASDWDAIQIRSAFLLYEAPAGAHIIIRREHYQYLTTPFLPPIALQKLAASPFWEVRYLVALHERTPWETRQHLSHDGNSYVRAIAQAVRK